MVLGTEAPEIGQKLLGSFVCAPIGFRREWSGERMRSEYGETKVCS